jgi:ferredoxin
VARLYSSVRRKERVRVSVEPAAVSAAVDRQKCTGYGICAEICPGVFKLDEMGFAYVDGPVPDDQVAAAREAAYECPEEAISVQPDEG